MAKVKFELNSEGVKDLMRSAEMMAVCKSYADKAVGSLGAGYSVNTFTGSGRVNAEVKADTYEARKENLENNSILKSLGG